MTVTQVILTVMAAIILINWARKFAISRKLTHYSAKEAKEKSKNPNVMLLDVRTAAERNRASIKGSIHIPVNQLKSRVDELKKYKSKEIICYCQTGSRSLTAASILYKAGFKSANMKDGIRTWNF